MAVIDLAEPPELDDKALEEIADWPCDFALVDLKDTFVDPTYQRELTTLAAKIGRQFNPALVGTIVLSQRRGGRDSKKGPNGELYAAIDGQTRRSGALQAGRTILPAVVFRDLTVQQEADLFELLQLARRGIAPHERFKSSLIAKRPRAIGIQKILKKYGYAVGPKNTDATNIQSVRALEHVWDTGEDKLQTVIEILHTVWGDFPDHRQEAFSEQLIGGLARFLRDTGGVDENRLMDRLARTTPSAIRIQAAHLRAGKNGGNVSAYTAEVIMGLYNARK